jgi:hypothetical protein
VTEKISLGIAGLALLFSAVTYWIERKQRRDELAEERVQREKELTAERTLRKEEVGLLRRQVEASERQHEEANEAYVAVDDGPPSEDANSYVFIVTNTGPSAARHLTIELRDSGGSVVASAQVVPQTLLVGDQGRAIIELDRQHQGEPLTVVVTWVDPSIHDEFVNDPSKRRTREVRPFPDRFG